MDYMNAAAQLVHLLIDHKALETSQPGHRRAMIERALVEALDIVEQAAKAKSAPA